MIFPVHSPRLTRVWLVLLTFIALPALYGCGKTLMPTPTLYQSRKINPFSQLDRSSDSTDAGILFVTDRQFSSSKAGWFNEHRNYGLNFGECRVQMGDGESWDAITGHLQNTIKAKIPVRIRKMNHMGSLPDRLRFDPSDNGAPTIEKTIPEPFLAAVNRGLGTDRSVFLYIHGYNNSFESSIVRHAGLWHWLGRRGVAIVYAWPSDNEFLGYLKDRESARFTIGHLKAFLKTLSHRLPEDTELNIVAHSTGVGLLIEALREIKLESGASARETGKQLKLKHLVAAAADLDTDVLLSRAIAEDVHRIAEHTTIYVSGDDLAIRLSNFFYFGITGGGLFSQSPFKFPRLGGLQIDHLNDVQRELIDRWLPDVDIIDVSRASVGWIKHDYFTESPAVSSDVILRLRYDLDAHWNPPLRPLQRVGTQGRLWRIERDYLQPPPPELIDYIERSKR